MNARAGVSIAVSIALHIAGLAWRPAPDRAADAVRTTERVAALVYPAARRPTRSVDVPVPRTTPRPRRVEIRRERKIHEAPQRPLRAAPRRRPSPRPPRPKRRPIPPPQPNPDLEALLTALAGATETPLVRVQTTRGPVFLALPGEDGPHLDWEAIAAGPLVIAPATRDAPAGESGPIGEWVALEPNDRLFRVPHDIRGWWPPDAVAWLGHDAGVTAIRLPLEVRAGWEARVPAALRLWDNLLADRRLRGLGS